MIAFLSSLQNLLDFFPAVADGHVLKFSNVERVGNDGDFVNVAVALKASTVCSTTILPATLKNCFGVESPRRLPTPPANMTAMFFSSFRTCSFLVYKDNTKKRKDMHFGSRNVETAGLLPESLGL